MKPRLFVLLFIAVLLLVLGTIAAACGDDDGEEEGITVEDFTGTWLRSDGFHLQFNEDGTFRFAGSVTSLENAPIDLGQFRLEGTLLTFTTSDESPNCAGQIGNYRVELTEEGQLLFALEEDQGCAARASSSGGVASVPWSRIEP